MYLMEPRGQIFTKCYEFFFSKNIGKKKVSTVKKIHWG